MCSTTRSPSRWSCFQPCGIRARFEAEQKGFPVSEHPEEIEFFDAVYREANGNPAAIPWADMEPTSLLERWLKKSATPPRSAIVVACGLGDDAEALAQAGWRVTAFDLSPTAITWCRERFPDTEVDYQVHDLSDVPAHWKGAFDLVMEARTIQSFPPERQAEVIGWISALVGAGGHMLVAAIGHRGASRHTGPPWPVAEGALDAFLAEGLTLREFSAHPSPWNGFEFFELEYLRP